MLSHSRSLIHTHTHGLQNLAWLTMQTCVAKCEHISCLMLKVKRGKFQNASASLKTTQHTPSKSKRAAINICDMLGRPTHFGGDWGYLVKKEIYISLITVSPFGNFPPKPLPHHIQGQTELRISISSHIQT